MYSDISSILNQSNRNPFVPTLDSATLESVVPILSSGVHRLPIFSAETKTLIGILSQTDFVLLLSSVKSDPTLTTLLGKTVEELGYTAAMLISGAGEMVYDILSMMKAQNINAVPLVNNQNELVGCFSASDIKCLGLEQWPGLFQDVRSFLAQRHPESLAPVYVRTNSTFSDVLGKMEQFKIHRVFVVDDKQKPVGVITMTDVLKWLKDVLSRG
jgi:CBS domain-containing protein